MPLQVLLPLAVVVVILALAVVAWVFVPAFQGPDAARKALGSHRLTLGAWFSVIVLSQVVALALNPIAHFDRGFTAGTFALATFALDLPMLLIVYVRVIMPGVLTWSDLGLRPLALDYVLRIGLAAGLAGLVLNDVIGSLLTQVGLRPNQLDEFQFVLAEGTPAFVVLLILAGVVAPFIEELFFRGFLFGTYRREQPLWLAYIVSSLLFMVLHLDPNRMNVAQMAGLSVGIFVLAIMLAWVYQHTGSLYPGIVAHAVNNATGVILFYALGIR